MTPAVVAPAATVTVAGTVSRVLLSESVTTVPPVCAALEIVAVQVPTDRPTPHWFYLPALSNF